MRGEEDIKNGSFFENFVAEELYRINRKLFYSQNKRIGEVGFIFYLFPVGGNPLALPRG